MIAMTNHYCTAEPFIDFEYVLRVQKIGDHYRAFKREYFGEWKTNTGSTFLTDCEVTPIMKFWADASASIAGGIDILAVDVLHGKDGKDYIIEVNDTGMGVRDEFWEEDCGYVAKLAINRMNLCFSLDSKF